MSSASGRRSAPAAPTKGLFSSRLFCSGGEVASVLAAAAVLRSIEKTGWLATGGALAVAATLGATAAREDTETAAAADNPAGTGGKRCTPETATRDCSASGR